MRLVSLVLMLGIFFFTTQANAVFFGKGMKDITAKDGKIIIDASKLDKVQAWHYRYQEDGKVIKFFIVRDKQGTLRTALDACEQCWRAGKGYKMTDDGFMLCVNCNMKFALNRIGVVAGGCNPHPFQYTVEGNSVVIATQELMQGAGYFPENVR